jgi:hypothetical protein
MGRRPWKRKRGHSGSAALVGEEERARMLGEKERLVRQICNADAGEGGGGGNYIEKV